jgi:photosystem II stability/assembly factor-like uncharacterized protein
MARRADANNGWMFGSRGATGFIFRTTNGGVSWVDETPNGVIVGGNAGPVYLISV